MDLLQRLKILPLLFYFLCSPINAETLVQVKGKQFIFERQAGVDYPAGQGLRFYDENGRLIFLALISKCNKTKCIAKVKGIRKSITLKKGMVVYGQKKAKPVEAVAQKEPESEAEDFAENSPENSNDIKNDVPNENRKQYLLKGGIGGQNSASAFAEFDFLGTGPWSYGLVLSSRIAARSDLDMSSLSYGGRVDYYFTPIDTKGFLFSLNLGMANVTYTVLEIEGVTDYSESETIPYFTLMGGYKFWISKALFTLAGGLSYMGYSDTLEDPRTQIVFSNPYSPMDLALELSVGFTF